MLPISVVQTSAACFEFTYSDYLIIYSLTFSVLGGTFLSASCLSACCPLSVLDPTCFPWRSTASRIVSAAQRGAYFYQLFVRVNLCVIACVCLYLTCALVLLPVVLTVAGKWFYSTDRWRQAGHQVSRMQDNSWHKPVHVCVSDSVCLSKGRGRKGFWQTGECTLE